jgi:2',3'-cyclic-nucleotide 2'-phosphodiesterase/3'-nucleotidase
VVFRADEELDAGPIRMRDLFRIYPFENDLTILELTVDDVRAYLEEIAQGYAGPARDGEPPPFDPRFRLYGHDALAPCRYVIDPARPVGDRVAELRFEGGELSGTTRLTLAVSSYRAQGGGGYSSLRCARVVDRTGRDLRSLLGAYIRVRGRIKPELFDNWSLSGAGDAGAGDAGAGGAGAGDAGAR